MQITHPVVTENIPKHLAIIMDGNGRWAEQNSLPRIAGHKAGVDALRRTVRYCHAKGIKHLTLFAFSTENWSRPKIEIDFLMRLIQDMINTELNTLIEKDIKLNIWGDQNNLSSELRIVLDEAKQKTIDNQSMQLNIALNYGGRWDIVNATKKIVQLNIKPEDITESTIRSLLMPQDQPDPDLLIRTSGEMRISNFLLWHLAYTEFYFTDILWPDFNGDIIDAALAAYQQRKRRYGGLSRNINKSKELLDGVE